jgi:hypothetical protein
VHQRLLLELELELELEDRLDELLELPLLDELLDESDDELELLLLDELLEELFDELFDELLEEFEAEFELPLELLLLDELELLLPALNLGEPEPLNTFCAACVRSLTPAKLWACAFCAPTMPATTVTIAPMFLFMKKLLKVGCESSNRGEMPLSPVDRRQTVDPRCDALLTLL